MRVLTWNIQWGRGADGRVDLARSVAAIRAAGEVELVCLQEVACNFPGLAGGAREDEPAHIAAAFPGFEAVFGAGMDVPDGGGGRARFGKLLLSRLPVGQVFRHLRPAPADADFPSMQRVCVEAVVSTARGPLRVMTTHLEYYSARPAPGTGRSVARAAGRGSGAGGGSGARQGVEPGVRRTSPPGVGDRVR